MQLLSTKEMAGAANDVMGMRLHKDQMHVLALPLVLLLLPLVLLLLLLLLLLSLHCLLSLLLPETSLFCCLCNANCC
jgi:hypothetical protein